MDELKRTELIETIKARGFLNHADSITTPGVRKTVLVTPREFFEGNDDLGSIGCNLYEHPGINTFRAVLEELEARDSVAGIHLVITDLEEDDPGVWPFSDTVYFVTTAPPEEIAEALELLSPDEVGLINLDYAEFANPPAIPAGYHLVLAWWD